MTHNACERTAADETGNGGPHRRLIALTDWPNHHPWPPIGGLRHLVFNADEYGFDRCVRRVGGRVLIDESEFFRWVDEQPVRLPKGRKSDKAAAA